MHFPSTILYEQLHLKLVHRIFYSSSVATPDYTIVYDLRDDSSFANYASAITWSEQDSLRHIRNIEQTLVAHGRRPTIYLAPDTTPKNLDQILRARGYKQSFTDAWMFFEGEARCDVPATVSVRTVDSYSSMENFVALFNRVYSGADPSEPYGKAPAAWGENLLESYQNTSPSLDVKYYIVQEQGEDAAIALSVSDGERAGLYSIGTIPERRRRGLSSIATLHAVNVLQNQTVQEIFLLTEKGTYNETFYRKLGFCTRWHATGWTATDQTSLDLPI